MKHHQIRFDSDWTVLPGSRRSQAAVMVIPPGGKEGGAGNRHAKSDQWLLVLSGNGVATVGGKKVNLKAGSLLHVAAGEIHEIRNTGEHAMNTVNFYAPPAY